MKEIRARNTRIVQQPFMFLYPSFLTSMVFAVAFPPRETSKLLKHPETVLLIPPALKLAETFDGIPEINGHGIPFSRPTG
jgi:hypothetical protein